ncbi:MAG: hypothetical protein RL139_718, partial [Gemmatimonadota bacterium]
MPHASPVRRPLLAGLLIVLACTSTPPALRGPTPAVGALRDVTPSLTAPLPRAAVHWLDSTLATMPLRDKVGQMVMIWVLGDYTSTTDSAFAWASDRLAQDHVGGVVMSLGSPIEVAAKVNALQRRATLPLLVTSDVEPGLGRL